MKEITARIPWMKLHTIRRVELRGDVTGDGLEELLGSGAFPKFIEGASWRRVFRINLAPVAPEPQ